MGRTDRDRDKATLIGFVAVLLWALLAIMTVGSAPVPPLQLNAMTLALGGAVGIVWAAARGTLPRLVRAPWRVVAFGTAGIFGYHFFYFSALRAAPPAQASLIAYLWPLLIVLFSALLPGERLRPLHLAAAAIGFLGAGLAIGTGGSGGAGTAAGYGFAALCALTWSGYSVLSRRLATVPTEVVALYCLISALLAAGLHLRLEDTVWPGSAQAWLAVLGLGLGPVGLAFYAWDFGVKRGDIQLLGTAAYAAPLLSTLVLVAAGLAAPSALLAASAVLIAGAGWLAAAAGRQG